MKHIYIISLILFSFLYSKAEDKVKIIEKETVTFSSLRLETGFSFTEIESVDSNGGKLRLISKSNIGVGLGYTEYWSKEHVTSLKANFNQISFNVPNLLNIESTEASLLSFGINHTYNFNENLRLNLGAYLSEEIFIRAKNSTTLTLDKFLNPLVKSEVEYDFVDTNNFKIGSNLNIEVSAPFKAERYESTEGNYEVDPSLGTGASIYARKFLNGYSIEGSIFYKRKNAKTSITEQITSNQGLTLRLAIPFGYNK